AASCQWDLASPRTVLLYFVRPPLPHSTGRPVCARRWKSVHLVAFTAVASFKGCFARACTSGCPHSAAVWRPFCWLHGTHASVRLDTRSLPPRTLGTICSISSGTCCAPQ